MYEIFTYLFIFETGSYYVLQVGLKCAFLCLSEPSTEIAGM